MMAPFDRVLSRLHNKLPHRWHLSHSASQPPPTYGPATLPGLPNEVLQEIAAYLPISSVAILTLTGKRLQDALGTKSWERLRNGGRERVAFLHLLARDLPDYVADFRLIKKLPKSLPSNRGKGAGPHYTTVNGLLEHFTRFSYAVAWPHVLLALKRNAFGAPHGIPLSDFKHTSKRCMGKEVVRFEALARIVSSHLLLRCTYTVSCKRGNVDLQDLQKLKLDICRHSSTQRRPGPGFDDRLVNAIAGGGGKKFNRWEVARTSGPMYHRGWDNELDADSIDDLLGTGDVRTGDISGQCKFCFTEYTASESMPESNGQVTLTVWHDFGTGSASANLHWTALTGDLNHYRVFPFGSVRDAFEQDDGSRLTD